MLNLLFWLTIITPVPFWFLLIFLTKHSITRRITSLGVAFILLGILYIFVMVGAVTSTIEALTSNAAAYDFSTAQGWIAWISLPAVSLAMFLHMAIMDLAGGHWIYSQAERMDAPRPVTSLCILLTGLVGPLGMFVFSLWSSLTIMRQEAIVRENQRKSVGAGA